MQANHFIKIVGHLSPRGLPPSLDLEWDPVIYQSTCSTRATQTFQTSNGRSVKRCDGWSFRTADEIIARANQWIHVVRVATGRDPIFYTNEAWWRSRIGKADRINEIKSKLVWIADYSRTGLATEYPKVPDDQVWSLWQFTDRGLLTTGSRTTAIDTSIFNGQDSDLARELGAEP